MIILLSCLITLYVLQNVFCISLHQNGIALAAKNRQKNTKTVKEIILNSWQPSIESQGNSITLAASGQGLFSWQFGRQVK